MIIFSRKWAFWAVQAGSIPKKIFNAKVCYFCRWVLSCFIGKKKYLKLFRKYFENIVASALKSCILTLLYFIFSNFFQKNFCDKIGYKFGPNLVHVLWSPLLSLLTLKCLIDSKQVRNALKDKARGKNTLEKEKYIAKKFGMEESFNFSWMIDKYPWKNDIKTMYVVLVFCSQNCSDLL